MITARKLIHKCDFRVGQEKEDRQRKKAKVAARSKLSFMGEEEDEDAAAAETIADGGAAKAEPPALPHHRRFAKLGVFRMMSSAWNGVHGVISALSARFVSFTPSWDIPWWD